jgi:membrane-associated phospholipid phosphatase
MRRALALLAALLVLAPRAGALEPPRPIRHDGAVDAALTGGAVALWLGTELAKPALAPARCRLCEPNALDAAAREAAVWSSPGRARRTSDVVAFALLPAGIAAHQLLAARRAGDTSAGLVDVLVVAEAAALTADLTQAVKYAAGRARPRALHRGEGEAPGPDDHLSFFSGHTSLAFSVVAAAGTVSTLRGYPSAPWVLGAGTAVAAGVGWLRMAGDAHWLTDVVAGAAVGTVMGIAVPRLLHGREAGAGTARAPLAAPPAVTVVLPF